MNRYLARTRCLRLGLLLALCLCTTSVYATPLASTIFVKDADGNPVEGAAVCIGSSLALDEFGTGTTDHLGQALINAALPSPPATVYITASKGAFNGQVAQPLSGSLAPIDLFATVQLSSFAGGAACPGGFEGLPITEAVEFSVGWEIEAPDIFAGDVIEIHIFLEQIRNRLPYPPPGPVPVMLESSDPRLLSLPRSVRFQPGQARQRIKAAVSGDVRRATTVTLRATPRGERPTEFRVTIKPPHSSEGRRN